MSTNRHSAAASHAETRKSPSRHILQRHKTVVDPAGGDLPLLAWGRCEVLPSELTEAERAIAHRARLRPHMARLVAVHAGLYCGEDRS